MPEKHAKLCERHVAALVAIATVRGYPLFASQRMAPVMLLVYTKQRAGVFSFQQPMPPGIKPPQHCASPGNPACRRYYCNQPFNSPSSPLFQNSARPTRSPAERSDAGMSTEQPRGRRKRLARATGTKKAAGFYPCGSAISDEYRATPFFLDSHPDRLRNTPPAGHHTLSAVVAAACTGQNGGGSGR